MFFWKRNGIKLTYHQIFKGYPWLKSFCQVAFKLKHNDIPRELSKIEKELKPIFKEITNKRLELSIKYRLNFDKTRRVFFGDPFNEKNFEKEFDEYLINNSRQLKKFKNAIKNSVFKDLLVEYKDLGISAEFYSNLDWLIID